MITCQDCDCIPSTCRKISDELVPASLVAITVYVPWSECCMSVNVKLKPSGEIIWLDDIACVPLFNTIVSLNNHWILYNCTNGEASSMRNDRVTDLLTTPTGSWVTTSTRGGTKQQHTLYHYTMTTTTTVPWTVRNTSADSGVPIRLSMSLLALHL